MHILYTIQKYYRVDRREIGFLRFILEGYDGIALLRTVDARSGLIALHIAPGCETDVETVLREMKREFLIEPARLNREDITDSWI